MFAPRELTDEEQAALTPGEIQRIYRSRDQKEFDRILAMFLARHVSEGGGD